MSETIIPGSEAAQTAAPALSGPWARGGPANEGELRFTRRPMVRWLDPAQLAGTAVRAVLSDVFGAYADQREMQAALRGHLQPHDYTDRDDVWIDYVSDLGDGFDSTYTVAWLLAQDRLPVTDPDGRAHDLPRGRVLVMGGDQVYPTASKQEYADRLEGPYEAALPCRPEDDHPDLFAVPGNHDWYDGLTSFMRQFCQERWIGGWRTRQVRSYFALRLPHGWWLLGTDLQLHSDIDKPQRDYFISVAKNRMKPGDRVILCTPEPAWVHVNHDPGAFDNLAFFEQKVLGDHGVSLALTLTGDLHHYARYADAAGRRHKITAGGGGAYLYGTDRLPDRVELAAARLRDPAAPVPAAAERTAEFFAEQKVYPGRGASARMRVQALFAVWKNGWFTTLLSSLYLLYAWVLQASPSPVGVKTGARFIDRVVQEPVTAQGAWNVLKLFGQVFRYSPLAVVLTLLLVGSLWAFCAPDFGRPKSLRVLGLVHGVTHVALALGLTWLVARLTVWEGVWLGMVSDPKAMAAAVNAWWFPLLFAGQMLVVGAVLGGLFFGLFLLPGVNQNEAFSAQYLSTYRNFLRLHIDKQGDLTVYPVGVRSPVRWKLRPHAPPGKPFFVPRTAGREPRAELIERPVPVDHAPPAQRGLAMADVPIVRDPDPAQEG